MPLQPSEKKQLTFAGVLFALAILFFVLFGSSERVALEYFYDESEQKLFTAPAGSIPPIKGINDEPTRRRPGHRHRTQGLSAATSPPTASPTSKNGRRS